jgi:hypothetical protein
MTSETSWRKSSYSGAQGGDCVEVGTGAGRVLVRDTKDQGTGPELAFGRGAWAAFAARVKADVR